MKRGFIDITIKQATGTPVGVMRVTRGRLSLYASGFPSSRRKMRDRS
jgi:hypothetical protein